MPAMGRNYVAVFSSGAIEKVVAILSLLKMTLTFMVEGSSVNDRPHRNTNSHVSLSLARSILNRLISSLTLGS